MLQVDEINVDGTSGVPLFENARPQVKITPRFERQNAAGKTVWTLRCPPDQLMLTLHSERDRAHSFEELHREMAIWLPRWVAHFDVKNIQAVALNYVNLLGLRTTPQFVVGANHSLQIDRLLNVFSRFQGPQLSIMPPYDCQVSLLYSEKPKRAFSMRVHGLPPSRFGSEVRVDFHAFMEKDAPESLAAPEVLAELMALHDIVRQQFGYVFTDEAKASFR